MPLWSRCDLGATGTMQCWQSEVLRCLFTWCKVGLSMIEALFAGVTLAMCLVLLLRLCLGWRRRQRFDAAVRRAWYGVKGRMLATYHWRSSRKEAARVAEEAIRRAKAGSKADVTRDGNVYRPTSFKGPRKPH